MSKDKYDVKDAEDYMDKVLDQLQELDRVRLWLALQGLDMPGRENLQPLYCEYGELHMATQAAVMYRFLPVLEQAALEGFQVVNKAARDCGAI